MVVEIYLWTRQNCCVSCQMWSLALKFRSNCHKHYLPLKHTATSQDFLSSTFLSAFLCFTLFNSLPVHEIHVPNYGWIFWWGPGQSVNLWCDLDGLYLRSLVGEQMLLGLLLPVRKVTGCWCDSAHVKPEHCLVNAKCRTLESVLYLKSKRSV